MKNVVLRILEIMNVLDYLMREVHQFRFQANSYKIKNKKWDKINYLVFFGKEPQGILLQ